MAVQTQSRTQMVRTILADLGTDTDAQKVIDEMERRFRQTCHSSLVYAERKKIREEEAAERRKNNTRPQPRIVPAPVPPVAPPAATVVTPDQANALLQPDPANRPADQAKVDLHGFTLKAKRVKEVAAEVGGYDNLIVLAEFLRGISS